MKTTVVTAFALTVAITNSYSWDSFGHMSVAYVAYQQLSPSIQQRANQLLKLNPQFNTWSSWIPKRTSSTDRDMIIFMLAATWPDEIKGIPHHAPPINPVTGQSYVADGTDNGDNPDGSPNPSANTGFSDNSMHKYWHFVDTPFSQDNSPLPPIPNPNAQERIGVLRTALASTASDDIKSYDLSWLLHLVGDVHQPLHCATRVSSADPKGDNGGNKVVLNSTELHAFWDDLLGTGTDKAIVSKVIKVAKKLPAADSSLAADANETNWVTESFNLAQTKVYVAPIGNNDGPFATTSAYRASAKDLADQRVALAGARLANLLNANLK